jgi:hypothetical protein
MSADAPSPKATRPQIQVLREALTAQHERARLAADEVIATGKALEKTAQDTAKIKLPTEQVKQ